MASRLSKEEYHGLLAEVGGGGQEIGAEAEGVRRRREQEVTAKIHDEYGGVLLCGDAIHQFYVDTVREMGGRLSTSTPQLDQFFLHWHILSCSRYYCAFDLFRCGYYFESSTLSRTLWETALSMAALNREVVSLEELLGGRAESEQVSSRREIIARVMRIDRHIQRILIWGNPQLENKVKEAVHVFLTLMNQATHKSSLGLATNLRLAELGQPIPIFPRFGPTLTEVSWNILYLSTWCLMETVSYPSSLLPGDDSPWTERYRKLLLVFQELNKTAPNDILSSFGEVVGKLFEKGASSAAKGNSEAGQGKQ